MIIAAISAAGCSAFRGSGPADMTAIDAALEKGPVFIEFGAEWCGWCEVQQPIVEELMAEYPGVTFMDIDVDRNASLADAFYVNGIPQMNVIVNKSSNGTYQYVDVDGQATGDRKKSAIVGYHEKPDLKKALDAAVVARG
jgi:thiol-disulfide isomerase/thioredoxin